MIIASILTGVGECIIWVVGGTYVSLLCTTENKGYYYGFFMSVIALSNVFGNALGSLILKNNFDMGSFVIAMTFLTSLATLMSLFVQTPEVDEEPEDDDEDKKENDFEIQATVSIQN